MNPKDLADEVAAYPRGKVPSPLRRRQILAEAHTLFVERGYRGASMDELARRIGVSKPVVYNLAGSKEQLFRDVMAMVNAQLAGVLHAATAGEATLEGKLRAGIRAFLEFVREHRRDWLALLATEAGPATTEVADIRRRQASIVAALLGEHIIAPGAAPDARLTEALGNAVNGAVEFVASWWLDHQDVSIETLVELLTRMLSSGLSSLATP